MLLLLKQQEKRAKEAPRLNVQTIMNHQSEEQVMSESDTEDEVGESETDDGSTSDDDHTPIKTATSAREALRSSRKHSRRQSVSPNKSSSSGHDPFFLDGLSSSEEDSEGESEEEEVEGNSHETGRTRGVDILSAKLSVQLQPADAKDARLLPLIRPFLMIPTDITVQSLQEYVAMELGHVRRSTEAAEQFKRTGYSVFDTSLLARQIHICIRVNHNKATNNKKGKGRAKGKEMKGKKRSGGGETIFTLSPKLSLQEVRSKYFKTGRNDALKLYYRLNPALR